MTISLPTEFQERLASNSSLNGAAHIILARFETWLQDNKLVFFPGYTDHGPQHIREVLTTAASLIRDEAWPAITADDVVVLIAATLLHDCAMHISADGFLAIVADDCARLALPDDESFVVLYRDFLGEAARFNSDQLVRIFGDERPSRTPPPDPLDWTERDRLLIGEFVRRHHPRIAHEIAIWGVPGPADDRLNMTELPIEYRKIAGVVARSHGVELRAAIEWLEPNERRVRRQVHVPFVMAVLRIADYLQIHSARAPGEILKVRSLRSPVSKREWSLHAAVQDVHDAHDDPEAIYVCIEPTDPKTHFRAKSLLGGLQNELDSVWANLGEVYGRFPKLCNLGICLRRVRSNLDCASHGRPYFEEEMRFSSAPEVLKLLIGPLYGGDPRVGIRELLQNAVDACRERASMLALDEADIGEKLKAFEVHVELNETDSSNPWIQVTDQGVGMTAGTIRSYFLCAGASFRRSDAWHDLHLDKSGRSKIARSGRFGVGALASFLLGPRIEVTTRHVDSPNDGGWRFSAKIDDEVIELWRCSAPVGTTVRVFLSANALKRLKEQDKRESMGQAGVLSPWYHYQLEWPRISYVFPKNAAPASRPPAVLPGSNSVLPAEWRRVESCDFQDIQWTFVRNRYVHREQQLYCNGIRVCNAMVSTARPDDLWEIRCPTISVFDHDGNLPLNLQRNGISADASVLSLVSADVVRAALAVIVKSILDQDDASLAACLFPARLRSSDIGWSQVWSGLNHGAWAISDVGVRFVGAKTVYECRPRVVSFAPSNACLSLGQKGPGVWLIAISEIEGLGNFDFRLRAFLEGPRPASRRSSRKSLWNELYCGSRVVCSSTLAERVNQKLPKGLKRSAETLADVPGAMMLATGVGCSVSNISSLGLEKIVSSAASFFYAEWYLNYPHGEMPARIGDLTEEIMLAELGTLVLPRNVESLRALLERSSAGFQRLLD